MTKSQSILDYRTANPTATYREIADALSFKVQYVYTVMHKAKTKASPTKPPTKEERQLVKGQNILQNEINNLNRKLTRLQLHNTMLQAMINVQDFDLMNRGTSI